jgi:hypothetical protein
MATIFSLQGLAQIAGAPQNGLTCVAYAEGRFWTGLAIGSGTYTPPSLGSGVPDANPPDCPAITSDSAYGSFGAFLFQNVPAGGSYWIAIWDPANPTVIAWEHQLTRPQTTITGWTLAVNQTANRFVGLAMVAAGSNGAVLPQATINVNSTTGFPASGNIVISLVGGFTFVAYTGITGTTFTGCTGGTGTLATSQLIGAAYTNGSYRRTVFINFNSVTSVAADNARVRGVSTVTGIPLVLAEVGVSNAVTGGPNVYSSMSFPIDPNGSYGSFLIVSGSGSVAVLSWVEVDS